MCCSWYSLGFLCPRWSPVTVKQQAEPKISLRPPQTTMLRKQGKARPGRGGSGFIQPDTPTPCSQTGGTGGAGKPGRAEQGGAQPRHSSWSPIHPPASSSWKEISIQSPAGPCCSASPATQEATREGGQQAPAKSTLLRPWREGEGEGGSRQSPRGGRERRAEPATLLLSALGQAALPGPSTHGSIRPRREAAAAHRMRLLQPYPQLALLVPFFFLFVWLWVILF